MKTEERIIELLESTKREGITELIGYLKEEGFFKAPASHRFHGVYEGGLADHSLTVYLMLVTLVANCKPQTKSGFGQMMCEFDEHTLIIAGLLHDVCKIGAYVRTKKDDGWTNNRDKEKGHAKLSLKRIKKYISLTKIEMLMIKFHMAAYGTIEFNADGDDQNGEYHIRGDHSQDDTMTKEESKKFRYGKSLANAWYHNPIVKLMSIADELSTMEEKAKKD